MVHPDAKVEKVYFYPSQWISEKPSMPLLAVLVELDI